MSLNRWKLLACAAIIPIFGCAPNRQEIASGTIQPPVQILSASYLKTLDQRILAQQNFAPPASIQLAAIRPASDHEASIQPIFDQPAFDQRILAVHNRERSGLGLVPLAWNPALARSARRWADYLAATGRFEHAPENYAAPQGENLWAGSKGYFTPEAMVSAWIREKRFFRPGRFPDNSTTGRVEDVGHYTQLVWRATTEVGCAEASGTSEDILVCRYAEAGNYRGEQPF
jgi:hypothetical protein